MPLVKVTKKLGAITVEFRVISSGIGVISAEFRAIKI